MLQLIRGLAFKRYVLVLVAVCCGVAYGAVTSASAGTARPSIEVQSWALYNGGVVGFAGLLDRPGDVACHSARPDGVATCFDTEALLIQDLVRLRAISDAQVSRLVREGKIAERDVDAAKTSTEASTRVAFLGPISATSSCYNILYDSYFHAGDAHYFNTNVSSFGPMNNRGSSYSEGCTNTHADMYQYQLFGQFLVRYYSAINQIANVHNNMIESAIRHLG